MSTTPSGATARAMICRTAWSSSSSGRASPGARLARTAWTAWKKATVPDAQSVLVWHRQRQRLGQLPHGPHAPVLAVLLTEDVLLRGR